MNEGMTDAEKLEKFKEARRADDGEEQNHICA